MITDPNAIWYAAEMMQAAIAREIRVLLGEESYDQRLFTPADRDRRVEALKLCYTSEAYSDAARHDDWMQMHAEQGWTYGPELLLAEKKHPNMLPWDELPQSTRSKARIFNIVADYAGGLAGEVV